MSTAYGEAQADQVIDGLRVHQSLSAAPEQYEVFTLEGEEVGYLRLRFGRFTAARSAELHDPILYEVCWDGPDDRFKGSFDTEEERAEHLAKAVRAIAKDMAGLPQDEPVWDTEELQRDYVVSGFQAPYVVVTRRRDSKLGSLMFTHRPRLYYRFMPA